MNPVLPASTADLIYIVANLSEQNRNEQRAFKLTDARLIQHLSALIDRGHSETLFLEGRPAYASGVVDGFTWFVATDAFFGLGIKGIRHARERMALVRKVEGKPLISLSRSTHPGTPKWFRALGFTEKPMRSVDGERMFVYP